MSEVDPNSHEYLDGYYRLRERRTFFIDGLRALIGASRQTGKINELQHDAYLQVIENWLSPPDPEYVEYPAQTVPLAIQMLAASFGLPTPHDLAGEE